MNTSPNTLRFQDTEITITDHNGQPWLTARDLSRALNYKNPRAVSGVYDRNKAEFSEDMTLVLNLSTNGFGNGTTAKPVRIFSPRGCHLIAMFARTDRAAEFRRWVLDVLEQYQAEPPASYQQSPCTLTSNLPVSIPTFTAPNISLTQVIVDRHELEGLLKLVAIAEENWQQVRAAQDEMDRAQRIIHRGLGNVNTALHDGAHFARQLDKTLKADNRLTKARGW